MSTHTLDTIGRKIDALIDMLLGRQVKLKTPTNEDLAEIVKQWENAAPGAMVDVPDGVRWPPIEVMSNYQARTKWMHDHATRGCRTSKHDGELAAAEAQAKLNRLLADVTRTKGGWTPELLDMAFGGDGPKPSAQPEAITTELECAGVDQYAIEIEHAGRRVRYEAPSVDGVRDLMRMNHEHKWWTESANAQAEFEQAQIDRAAEKFEAEKQRAAQCANDYNA